MPQSDFRQQFESKKLHTPHSPNLIPAEHRLPEQRIRPHRRKLRWFSCFFIVLAIVLTSCSALLARSNNGFFVGVKNGFIARQITHIFTGSRYELRGEPEDRINFLLMGIGGPGHDGPYLTDTIILASFRPSTKEAAMVSIPRDLIVPDGNGSYIKINHIYALNQKKGLAEAFRVTKETIGNAFGVPIHYMGVVDFDGFVKVIDTIGGIEITVDKAFSDYEFPAGPGKYQSLSFKAGKQKMNGLTALQFARSRHGNNGEGSDFARSKRQQKIIAATMEKTTTFNTLLNPKKLTSLYNLINEYTKTDVEPWEMVKLVQMGKDVSPQSIKNFNLDDGPNGLLYSGISSLDGAYILQPRGGSYKQIQQMTQNMLGTSNQFVKESPALFIQNGTLREGLASTVSEILSQGGITPLGVGNAAKKDQPYTVLYDYTDGKKPQTRAFLESRFNTTAMTDIPLELLSYTIARQANLKDEAGEYRNLDFLLILGEDIENTPKAELIRTLTQDELKARQTSSSTPTTTASTITSTSTPSR